MWNRISLRELQGPDENLQYQDYYETKKEFQQKW